MLNYDLGMICLFKDSQKLERAESSPDLQLREPSMKPTEDTREVACDIENLVSLQVFRLRLSMAMKCSLGATRTLKDRSLRDTVGCNSKSILDTL